MSDAFIIFICCTYVSWESCTAYYNPLQKNYSGTSHGERFHTIAMHKMIHSNQIDNFVSWGCLLFGVVSRSLLAQDRYQSYLAWVQTEGNSFNIQWYSKLLCLHICSCRIILSSLSKAPKIDLNQQKIHRYICELFTWCVHTELIQN